MVRVINYDSKLKTGQKIRFKTVIKTTLSRNTSVPTLSKLSELCNFELWLGQGSLIDLSSIGNRQPKEPKEVNTGAYSLVTRRGK